MSELEKLRPEVAELLPLPHLTFHILVAVAEAERYGYDMLQEVQDASGGNLHPSIGSLYLAIQRLEKQGLIVESTDEPGARRQDSRRRYYRATPLGLEVAAAEADRLAALLGLARRRHLLGTPELVSGARKPAGA